MFLDYLIFIVFLVFQEGYARSIGARSALSTPPLERNPPSLDTVSGMNLIDYEVRSVYQHSARDLTSIGADATTEAGLRNSESFYWGRYGYPLANFTAYEKGDKVKMLSMERFGAALSKAKCSSNSVTFTFPTKSHFDNIKEEWSWVNSATDNYIVLVTENARCNVVDGDPGTRQPWHVTSAIFDPSSYTATLRAEPKSWQAAFSDWRLTVKTRGILPAGAKVKRDDTTLHRRYNITGSSSVNLTTDLSNRQLLLGDEDGGGSEANIACADCGTTGDIDFELDVVPKFLSLPPHLSGSLNIIGNNIGATFGIDVSAEAALDVGLNAAKTLFSAPLSPDLGFSIDGIFEAGFVLKLNLAAGIGKTALGFNITTGVEISIPTGSNYTFDFDTSQSDTSGWNPTFAPKSPSMSGNVAVTGDVGAQFILEFGGTVLGVFAAEVGVMLAAPTMGITVNTTSGTDICGAQGADFGVNLGISYGGSIDTFEIVSLIDVPLAHKGFTQTLFATTIASMSTCITMAQASIAPNASFAPSAPVLPSIPVFTIAPSGNVSSAATSSIVAHTSSMAAPASSAAAPTSSIAAPGASSEAAALSISVPSTNPAPSVATRSSIPRPLTSFPVAVSSVLAPGASFNASLSSIPPSLSSGVPLIVLVPSASAAMETVIVEIWETT